MKNGWYSVRDQGTPELVTEGANGHWYSQPYLLTYLSFYDGKTPCTSNKTAVYCSDKKWYWGDEQDCLYSSSMKMVGVQVIAYMPLPAPYKG